MTLQKWARNLQDSYFTYAYEEHKDVIVYSHEIVYMITKFNKIHIEKETII